MRPDKVVCRVPIQSLKSVLHLRASYRAPTYYAYVMADAEHVQLFYGRSK